MSIENYTQARELIDPKYRGDFDKFVETGLGSEEFMDYLDNNKPAQEAIEWCFEKQAAPILDEFRRMIQNDKKNLQ